MSAMIVTLKPPGREEYALTLDGPPVYSFVQFGGMEAATIPCQLDDTERLYCLGSTVRIHGTSGIVWQGIVTRRPGLNEPLLAQGWGWCAELDRSTRLFTKSTGILDACYEWDVDDSVRFRRYKTAWGLVSGVEIGATAQVDDNAGWMYRGDKELGSIGFTATVNNTLMTLKVQGVDWDGNLLGDEYVKTTATTETSQSLTFAAGTYGFAFRTLVDTAVTPTSWASWTAITSIKLYGTDSSTTPNGIINAILDGDVDTQYLPAGDEYRAWIGSPATTIDPLEFDVTTAAEKIAEVAKFDAYDYGWYPAIVSGHGSHPVPHYTARSTTPDYIIRLADAESEDIDEASLGELYSDVIVRHQDTFGNPRTTRVTATDTDYPLVGLGITRTGVIDIQCVSEVTAGNRGSLFLADEGRAQVKGSLTTRYVYSATGADVYLPTVRPGRMAALEGLPQGRVNTIVKRVECIGDEVATIELDNEGYRLDLLLARRRGNT